MPIFSNPAAEVKSMVTVAAMLIALINSALKKREIFFIKIEICVVNIIINFKKREFGAKVRIIYVLSKL